MRMGIADLPTPHPIGDRLPSVYQDGDFVRGFTSALDGVLAPAFVVLDCFAAYLDPHLTPPDFIDWLATWVGLEIDEGWPEEQRRELVASAVELHRWRGTCRGLATQVRLLTGGEVEVTDNGGCAAADRPDAPLPGAEEPAVVVRIRLPDPGSVDRGTLLTAITEVVPAHVRVHLELVAGGAP
jgi:phage tail-like protein